MRIALATQVDATEFALDDEAYLSALREAGAEVELAAWDDPDVDWSRFDGVQIRTTWNYHEQPEAFRAWCQGVAEQSRLFNGAAVVEWNANKTYLREVEAAGIPIVPTRWIDPGESIDIAAALERFGTTRGFLKPAIGANASGTLRFALEADGTAPESCATHLSEHGRNVVMMLQPYLSSVEESGELSLIYFGGELSHCVRKIPKAGDYRVQDDHGASDRPETPTSAQLELAQRCLDFVNGLPFIEEPLLYARVDLMTGPAGQDQVGELELIEPCLFFRHDAEAAPRLAAALLRRLRG
jgi:hypothetical protein